MVLGFSVSPNNAFSAERKKPRPLKSAVGQENNNDVTGNREQRGKQGSFKSKKGKK